MAELSNDAQLTAAINKKGSSGFLVGEIRGIM